MAGEFPDLYAFYSRHPGSRSERSESWERDLRVARNSQPILADLRSRGLNLVRLDQYTPPGTDLRPLYQTILEWLDRIQDPLTLTICLSQLTNPGACSVVKKNRELLLRLTREWNSRLRGDDRERTLSVLSQCVMKAVLKRDLPEVLQWIMGSGLPWEARYFYVLGLKRFARRSGLARDAIIGLVHDSEIGGSAVWALAGALKAEALPLLHQLRESSPHAGVRTAAAAATTKIEARLRRVELGDTSPAMLPQGYASMSIEFDTDRVPELLRLLEREMKGKLKPGDCEQLALSSNQLKRGSERFHIVSVAFPDGIASLLGFGILAEDEDVIVVKIHFDERLRDAVDSAFRSLSR